MPRKRRYTQKELVDELRRHGWTKSTGGKHQVKMVKPGSRPITVPQFKGQTLPIGLSLAILKQAEIGDDS
ncbi:MAG: type II toxin-antitoxin system HicA family toxin [Actinomycetota bacterium]